MFADRYRHRRSGPFGLRRLLQASAVLLMISGAAQGAERLAALVPHPQAAHLSTYVIERNIPGAGKLSPDELRAVAQKSGEVLRDLGPGIRWIQSYVVDDKIYCVYASQDPQLIRRHAERGGFPADRILRIHSVIGPQTADLAHSSQLLTEPLPLPHP